VEYYGIMHKKTSVVFSIMSIAAAAVLLAGSGTVFAVTSNTGINVQTDMNVSEKQEYENAGGSSTIYSSCIASSTNTNTNTGGVH
jgi:hypothetical protein